MFHPSHLSLRTNHRNLSALPMMVIILIIAGFVAIAVTARGWLAPPIKSISTATPANSQPPTQNRSEMEAETITITPLGFDPPQMTRPKGAFLLVINNRTGLDEITFRLDREAGNRLHEVRVPREQLDWDTVIYLHPGTYLLTEASHPEWECRITITAQ